MDIQSFVLPHVRPSPFHPPVEYAALRADSPVQKTVAASGAPVWLVIGADAAQQALADRRLSITPLGEPVDTESLLCDGEHHARLRRVMSRGLTARTLEALRPRFDRTAADCVAEMRAVGPPADLVALLSKPLTLAMISDLLGVPVDDRERFYTWAEAASVVITDDFERIAATWGELVAFLSGLIEAKRADPGEDLLSALIAVRDADDGRLNDRELVNAACGLLSGGQLTTVNSLSIGMIKLLDSGGLTRLRGDGPAIELAVEEMLRHQAGISGEAFPRWVREDTVIGGTPMARGEMVIVRLEGANRDPARFADPDTFNPTRSPNPHLRFGHGPHRCVGAALARMELVAAVTALADQLPDLALTCAPDEVEWTDQPLDSGPARLEVTW